MPIKRPADARPVAPYEFRGFNGLIGHRVVSWRPGFVEFELKVRPELCNANGLLHGGVLMTLLDGASGFACTFNDTATARRVSATLAFTTQFIKAGRDGDTLTIFGAWRPSTSQSTFAAETEIYDQHGDLVATGAGTFRYLKGERSDGMLTFLDKEAAD
ncbi:MAG: PaaI family thioesterase [Alphaproteobacteria bacterium]|nr:PaaI family thioesterase [Alphaproteobacteria bacterium]